MAYIRGVLYQDNLICIEVSIEEGREVRMTTGSEARIEIDWYALDLFGMESRFRAIQTLFVGQWMSALDVKTYRELFLVLNRDYNTADAFDRFLSFVSNNHLEYDYIEY